MERPKRYRSLFIGLTLGVVVALFLWPATRWLVAQQVGMALHVSSSPLNLPDSAMAKQIADRHPADFSLQLAAALTVPPSTIETPGSVLKRQRLQELAKRFPENPAVYANLL